MTPPPRKEEEGEGFPITLTDRERSKRPGPVEPLDSIPCAMIAPHEAQALKNHGDQTLKRLAERGGLSAAEACAVLEDRRWEPMANAHAHLRALLLKWESGREMPKERER